MQRVLALFCLALACAVSGCSGWYLRGTGPESAKLKDVLVIVNNAPQIGGILRNELYYNGVTQVATRDKAKVVLELNGENFERRVVSVDPTTGKLREIELTLEVKISVRGPGGKLLVNNQTMSWSEDFVFDEISALGTEAQEITIKLELSKTASRALVLRLETLDYDKALQEPERKEKTSSRTKRNAY